MAIRLGAHRYGKAETRIVRVTRDDSSGPPGEARGPEGSHGARHELTDLTVSIALAGALEDTHLTGDNSRVLPTDSQKNTVYAFAREHGIGQIEDFGLLLARHFVDTQPAISQARVRIDQYGWHRLGDHSFQRDGGPVRTASLTYDGQQAWAVSGLT